LPRPFFPNQNNNKTKYEAARSRERSLKKDIKCVVVRPFNNRTASTKQKKFTKNEGSQIYDNKKKIFLLLCFFYSEQETNSHFKSVCDWKKKTLND